MTGRKWSKRKDATIKGLTIEADGKEMKSGREGET